MPLNPGNDTITFTHVTTTGTPDRWGVIPPTNTSVTVRGCSLQSISDKDNIGNTTYSESTNKCITQFTAFTSTIVADDYLHEANGKTYRVTGIRTGRDAWARNDHISIMCKYESGG